MRPQRRIPALLVMSALSAVLVLSACGGLPDAEAGRTATARDAPAAGEDAADGESIVNCGTAVEVAEPPERILTIKSTATELVLSLGLGDRLVGTAFSDGPLPEGLADEATDVPEVSDGVPGQEAVLELGPDLVFAGWESAFSADGVGERGSLHSFGVSTYVAPAACQGEHRPEHLDFDGVFDDIREAGTLLGAERAADDLVSEQRELLGDLDPIEDDPTALWYSSGTDTPYVGAGSGAPHMMLQEAGFQNIADDVDDTWTSLSWEVIAERDPDVIVLVDAAWNTAEDKIARLESSPVTSQLSAVRDARYLRVPFAASEAGVRNVEAVADLVQQYADLG
ncbi:MAG TPA: putative F420-0 ABC transporter substrate-binding protein [Brevibacterium sp.]|nr:putative F420-0 ABC transporter substrate-binding protein [Brevibacterium sp.]